MFKRVWRVVMEYARELSWTELQRDWYYHKMSCLMGGYDEDGNIIPGYNPSKWMFAWQYVKGLYAGIYCAVRNDHDWVDDSYGGPDSGCVSGFCKNCGYSVHHQLY